MAAANITPKVTKTVMALCLVVLLTTASGIKSWGQTNEAAALAQAQEHWKNRHWEAAVLAFEDYLKKYPDGSLAPHAFLHLGKYLEGHKRLEEARQYYQAGVKKATGKISQILQTEIADVEMKFGNHDKVVKIYQEILDRPESWDMFKIANKKLLTMHFRRAKLEKEGRRSNACGEESLKTVLKQLGLPPREEVFRKLSRGPESQTSMAALKQAARAHGLESYGMKVADGSLARVAAPAILLCRPAHYTVFQGLAPDGVKIVDSSGVSPEEKVVSLEELKENWTGYALGFKQKQPEVIPGVTLLSDGEMKGIKGGFDQPGDSFASNKGMAPFTEYIDPPNILVNSFSLNLVIEDLDAVWRSPGHNLTLKRTYNSEDPASGMFGHSWHFQYEIFLTEDVAGNVTLTREGGRVDQFTKKGDGTFAPPKAVFDKLVKNPDGTFTLLVKNSKSTYYFGSNLYLTKIVDKNSNVVDFAWGPSGITEITVHYGNNLKKILFEYGAAGKCTQVTLPDGRSAAFTYAADGTLLSSTDLAGYQTSYTYDANKYITAVTTPRGTSQVVYQHSPGNYNIYAPQQIIDPLGYINQFTVSGIEIIYTDPAGRQTRYAADGPTGFTGTITGPLGGVTSFTYDSYGNRTSVTDATGSKWVMSYGDPASGNLTAITDPSGKSVSLAYSAADDLIALDAPLGRHSEFQYDANHNLVKAVDALSRGTAFTHNARGELTKILLPGNPRPQNTFVYNAYGHLISETDASGNLTKYGNNAAGRLTSRTDANGNVVRFSYDKLDRLKTASYPDGKVIYTYDATSLRSVTAKDGRKMTFAYDKDGRLLSFKDLNGFLIKYRYDKWGNLISLTYPGNKLVKYRYDQNNRLTRVTDWLQNATVYTYDLAGNLAQVTYPNGTKAKSFYDKNQRLIAHQNFGVPGSSLPQFAYLLDDLGNRIGETRRNSTFEGPSWKNISSGYDLADRILNDGSALFQHDANGNLVQKTLGGSTWNYVYDYNNLLTQFQAPGQTCQYEYDPLLNRIARQEGDEKNLWVVDPNGGLSKVLMQTTGAKVTTDYYIYGLGLISRLDAAGNAYYYHYDGLGSTVAVTDAAGLPVNRYSYDPFGNLLASQEAFENPFRYVGGFGVMDERNGLSFMRSRYYEGETGRFINKDPIGIRGGLNCYEYAMSNPINCIDPLGLTPKGRWSVNVTWDKDLNARGHTQLVDPYFHIINVTLNPIILRDQDELQGVWKHEGVHVWQLINDGFISERPAYMTEIWYYIIHNKVGLASALNSAYHDKFGDWLM